MNHTNGTTTAVNPHAMTVRHEAPIEPANMGELQTLATAASKTGFYGAKTPEQALMIAMSGKDLGLSYTQALRAFHVIEGRPALSADGMVAVCLVRKDICEYFRVVESDDKHAVVETKRVGDPLQRMSFTVDEAKRAGLVKERSNWEKWPGRMCVARAKSFLARQVYPDLLMGLYDQDEAHEIADDRRPHVEPVRVVPPVVVADAEYTQVEDPSIALSEDFQKQLLAADTLEARDEVVKAFAKAFKAKRISQLQYDGLGHTATERKKALEST